MMFGGVLIDFDFNTYDFDFWQPFLRISFNNLIKKCHVLGSYMTKFMDFRKYICREDTSIDLINF